MGILLARSVDMVSALLGVCKAGGAYLPLGVEHPPDRLAYMLRDAQAPFLISRDEFASSLPPSDVRLIDLGAQSSTIAAQATGAPNVNVRADDLAFCIYTSGSTGEPKGVLVSHNGIGALVEAQRSVFRVTSTDRVLQFASFGFDAFLFEMLMAFSSGASLVLRDEQLGEALVDQLDRDRVTIATLPPSILGHISLARVRSLRYVIAAGEACPPGRIHSLPAGCQLINAYGPTEATIWATAYGVPPEAATRATLPIGRAIGGTDVLILDEQLIPTPPGETGEIHLGGLGLARGYLGCPALTAEKFIPHPFGPPGSRLYKTGDLGCWSADGEIEFNGRIDHQVKLHGYRIELGEVEAALCRCAGVRGAAVVVREFSGHKQLVAYIAGSCERDGAILAEQLRRSLPDYMIPTRWAFLSALPINPNGKIDRKALEALNIATPSDGSNRSGAGSPTEQRIARLWGRVLGVQRVGLFDGFRSLGGRSIQAIDVAHRVGVEFGLGRYAPYPLGNTTVAEYASAVDTAKEHITVTEADHTVQAAWASNLASYAQQQVCFLEQLGDGWRAYRAHAQFVFKGCLHVGALQCALNALARRHEIIRTGFEETDGVWYRRIYPDIQIELPVVDLSLDTDGKLLKATMERELQYRFDLSKPPLIRWVLLKLASDHHVLLQTEHHNVHDGQSFRILVGDLAELYSAQVEDRSDRLPNIEAEYRDYCADEQRWLASDDFERVLDAWQTRLLPFGEDCLLHFRHPARERYHFYGAQRRLVLDEALARRLGDVAAQGSVSLYGLMLSAFGLLCNRFSGQSRFLVGSALANRMSPIYRHTVGMFVNMLPIPFDLDSQDLSFDGVLGQVSSAVDFALLNSSVPLAEIVKRMGLSHRLSGNAPFNVAFSFHDSLPAKPRFAGVDVHLDEALSNGSAKFDLSVVGILRNETSPHSLDLLFEYDLAAFDSVSIEHLVHGYQAILEAVVASPQTKIKDLPLLTREEEHQLLVEWNDTNTEFPKDKCIHQLFEEQAAKAPDAVAVVFEDQQLTYGELNAKANRLAHYLRELGVKPDILVAICVERSLEMIVGLLGILKAGGAYVPLDPNWPTERRRLLLKMLDSETILTCKSELQTMERLAWEISGIRNICCLDGSQPDHPEDEIDRGQVAQFWNFVAERSDDEILSGGFISSYTRDSFTPGEVGQYVGQVLALLGDKVGPGRRILELGCGSGAIAFELLARGVEYVGIDPSAEYQRRNGVRARDGGFANARFDIGFAHDLEQMEQGYDAIVLPSVTQFFPSYRYLDAVLSKCLTLILPGGKLVVADVMDPAQRDGFAASLSAYKNAHPQAPVKIESESELHVAERYFTTFAARQSNLCVEVVRRSTKDFTTELVYRYDVVFTKPQTTVCDKHSCETLSDSVRTFWPASYAAGDVRNPLPGTTSESTAYVIYTSGSTGQPKGVIVRHRPVVNLISWVNHFVGVSAADRLFFVTSMCFDLSVYDIFGVLAAGGSVDIVPSCMIKDPERLARYLLDRPITFWDSAPAAFGYIAPYLESSKNGVARASLRTVFLSGDWIPLPMPDKIRAQFPAARVIALGGATEAAIWSNYFVVDQVESSWRSIPYGKPIQNARYYILNERLLPQPIGIPGDLYIGGECLASGYLGDAAMTATKFIPDPYAGMSGQVMYRTGDLARYLPDGNIEFLGRSDHQVKIRGFRIELGEIEAALLQCPGIRDAVVLAREDSLGDKRLTAYLVLHPETTLTVQEVRTRMLQSLPEYMLPSAWMRLEALPITTNGKVDRNAVSEISLPLEESVPIKVSVNNENVSQLLAVLAVLQDLMPQIDLVGSDDLFVKGIHSVLMMKFVARCRQRFGVELRLRDIYRLATPLAIAKAISDLQAVPA